ncbi:MAG: PadR family transcriptional regulator [Promethearchaeota archaeon]
MVWFGKGFTNTSHGRISPVQFMILLILRKKAEKGEKSHGYELLQELSGIFSGVWKPKSGTVYPALKSLEERGFLESEKVEQEDKPDKKTYEITEDGKAVVDEVFESFEEEVEFSEEFGAKVFEYLGQHFGRKIGSLFSKLLFHEDMSEIHHLKERRRKFKERMRHEKDHWHHWGPGMMPWMMMPWMKYLFSGESFPDDDRKEMLERYKARLQKELEKINEKLENMKNESNGRKEVE